MTLKGIIENVVVNMIAAVVIGSTPMAEPPSAHKGEPPELLAYQERRSSSGRVEADLSWISVTVEWERSVGISQERESEK